MHTVRIEHTKKGGYSFLFFTNSKNAHFILAFLETISHSLCFSCTHTFLCSCLSFLTFSPSFCFNDTSHSELAKQRCVLYLKSCWEVRETQDEGDVTFLKQKANPVVRVLLRQKYQLTSLKQKALCDFFFFAASYYTVKIFWPSSDPFL